MFYRQSCFALFASLFASCTGQPASGSPKKATLTNPAHDQLVHFKGVDILIKFPVDSVAVKGDLLLLPGWNFSNKKWCDSTDVCSMALQKGYRVVAPQMGQSIYATRYFAETRADLRKYPTLLWLDSALNYLHDTMRLFGLKNYVLGLSTGARGVAQICEKRPGFFHAAAALSGDYNQLTIPNDPLCTLVYGSIKTHLARWKMVDNPEMAVKRMTTPLYLGHGRLDKVVPVAQTISFANSMHKNCPLVDCVLHIDETAGHSFTYWRSELSAVWQFFDKH